MKPKANHPWKAEFKQRPPEQWTEQQLAAEKQYRIDERIGLLCGESRPTLSARYVAEQEAEEAIEVLRRGMDE